MKTPEINKNTILTVLIIGAVIFLFFAGKGILQSLGLTKSESQQQAANLAKEAGKVDPAKTTITQNQAVNIADGVHNALKYTSLDDNKPEAVRLLRLAQSDDDFKLIQTAFGERKEYAFGIPTGSAKTLAAFISDNLNKSQKADLKADYQRKGIKTVI